MNYRWPLDTMRDIAANAANAWLPDDNNAVRVRKSGGTRHVSGDIIGKTEEREDIKIAVFRPKAKRGDEPPGPREAPMWTAIFTEDLLSVGDEVEWKNYKFVVRDLGLPELNNQIAFRRAFMERLE